jgi:ATP-dependent DNA helicase RecQ
MKLSNTVKEASSRPKAASFAAAVERPPHFASGGTTTSAAQTYTRPRPTPEPAALTADQQTLDARLREWRQAESEKLNLPLFFVLASTTLRNIVLAHPQNLSQLKAIQGLGHDKIEKFGPGILQICTS